MKQKEKLLSRVQNQIQIIKRTLSRNQDFELYNDFLIISEIVPKLPEQTLVEILTALKPFNDKFNKTPLNPPSLSIRPLLIILGNV